MASRQTARLTTQGKCNLCEKTFSKTSMGRHLAACTQRGGSATAPGKRSAETTETFLLKVEGRHRPQYWMFLQLPASATLLDLDNFLRATWLECCGHLSAFRIGGKSYVPGAGDEDAGWELGEEDMDVPLGNVLRPGLKFTYEYDFGSTTELALQVVSQAEGETAQKPVRVLARNEPPSFECVACGKPATQVCTQCVWEGTGCLCEECATAHGCGEEMLLPLVNSPRAGVCAYTGK